MGDVIHSMGSSLDGFVEDARGDYQFSVPPEDLHAMFNQQMRDASALVFGRRVFDEMRIWYEWAEEDGHPPVVADFAAAFVETPVYLVSDTITEDEHATVVPRAQARDLVQQLRDTTDGLVEVSGPTFAASVIDLVDEFRLWVSPVLTGGGKPYFPHADQRVDLRLAECREFAGGMLYLRYRRA